MKQPRIEPYTALIIQPEVTVVQDRDGIRKNLDRVCNMIHFGVGYFWEIAVRLVVLPECFMQGVGTPGKGESDIGGTMKKAVYGPDARDHDAAGPGRLRGGSRAAGTVRQRAARGPTRPGPPRWRARGHLIGAASWGAGN